MADQMDRIAIVTGSNSGIGFETARVLALKNATVIMAVHNQQKVASNPLSHNEEIAERLWALSEKLTGIEYPG